MTDTTFTTDQPLEISDWPTPWQEVLLHLDGAAGEKDLRIHLQYLPAGRRWNEKAWGYGLIFNRFGNYEDAYNGADHPGRVVQAEQDGQNIRLRVKLDLLKDRYGIGEVGPADLKITLVKQGDELTGRFAGQVLGRSEQGSVTGRIEPVWPVPVADHEPLRVQQHPRLMFRPADLPEIRRRAATVEGQAIIDRLKHLLQQRFSVWNGIGWGMLYQVTGRQEYADYAARDIQAVLSGRVGKDERYAWATGREPHHVRSAGASLRLGPTLAAVAGAYDLCYNAWNEDLKRSVVEGIQSRLEVLGLGMEASSTVNPHSNHYGAWNGGAATAILAILGDPYADDGRLQEYLDLFVRRNKRAYEIGFGDHGWFTEGHHPSRIAANTGLSEFVLAYRNVCGLDLAAGKPNVEWTALRWAMNIVPIGGKPQFPHRGPYGGDFFDQGGNSHDGDFSHGFALVKDPDKRAAMKWIYNHFVAPHSGQIFNAGTYAHRAAAALVNWPVDTAPAHPDGILPKALRDRRKGYYMFRNRWKDGRDTLITLLINSEPARGCHQAKTPCLRIFGLGLKHDLPDTWIGAEEVDYRPRKDGSGVADFQLNNPQEGIEEYRGSFAVDFDAATGPTGGVIILHERWQAFRGAKGQAGKTVRLAAGDSAALWEITLLAEKNQRLRVWALTKGPKPDVTLDGNTLTLAGRSYRLAEGTIQLP